MVTDTSLEDMMGYLQRYENVRIVFNLNTVNCRE